MFDFDVKRSGRKTLSVEISPLGKIIVRAPYWLSSDRIKLFLLERKDWIMEKREAVLSRPRPETINRCQLEMMRKKAKDMILPRVDFWSEKTGLSYGKVKITSARGRLGSCSSKNDLCFSLYLANFPSHLVDYVIVHELCHTAEHNHSSSFYHLLARFFPDWKELRNKIKSIPIPILSDNYYVR